LAAADDGAGARLGDNHLGAALGATVSFTYLICHLFAPLYETFQLIIISLIGACCQSWEDKFYRFLKYFSVLFVMLYIF